MRHSEIHLKPAFTTNQLWVSLGEDDRKVESFSRGAPPGPREPQYDRARLAELLPQRDLSTPPHLLDLYRHYNAPLQELFGTNQTDVVPRLTGTQVLAEVPFDVGGIIAPRGGAFNDPRTTRPTVSMTVNQIARRVHFLHGARGNGREGSQVGYYLIHFASGQQRIHPILYGFDVRETHERIRPNTSTGLVIAWPSRDDEAAASSPLARLYKSTWENPFPDQMISAIDFVANPGGPGGGPNSRPFLVAITLE